MFHEHRLLHKVPTEREVLEGLGTQLPEKSTAHFQQIERSDEGYLDIQGPGEMVVFVPEENPEQILDHPILGPFLRQQNHVNALFAERRNPVNREYSKTLKHDVISIPVNGFGSVRVIHLMGGSSPEGDPQGDEFHLPRKVRSTAAAAKNVVTDLKHEGEDAIGIYLDGQVVTHQNAAHYVKALGKALGNVTYNTDLYRTEAGEKSVDGRLSDAEKAELALAKEQGWESIYPDQTPEAEFAELHRNIKLGEFTLKTPEDAVRTTRDALKHVYLVSDIEGDVDGNKLCKAFEEGDMVSRVQSLVKFLAEAPHNLLDCALFVKALSKLTELVAQDNDVMMEVYGPKTEGIQVDGSTQSFGRKLSVMEAVHAGSGNEKGPFFVRISYRHPNAEGKPVHILAGKSVMFDNGGNNNKGEHAKSMQGDMMGGASVAAEFARFGEEQPVANVDFVFGIASNKADGNSRNIEDVYTHGSGITTEEANTDAEGRQVLADAVWAAMRILREEGEEISGVIDLATLTGAAVVAGGHRTLAITSSRKERNLVEALGIKNGDRVQPEQLVIEDQKATGHTATSRADIKNVDPRRIRGAQNAAAYIKTGAGIKETPFMHFDIAPSMNADKFGTPKDVQGEFAAEGYLDTVHQYLMDVTQR